MNRTPTRRQCRPSVVALEGRCVPAVIAWDGGPTGNGTNWLTAANWEGDVLPGASDDVTFGPTGFSPVIELRQGASVRSVTSARQIRIVATNGGTSILNVGAGGLTNNSRLELSSDINCDTEIVLTGGTLINAAGGVLDAVGGGNSQNVFLNGGATLDNQGALSVAGGGFTIHLNGAAQALTNPGTVEVTGGDLIILQQSGDSFTTTNAINVALGRTFTVNGGALNYQAGTVAGGGSLALKSAALNLLSAGLAINSLTLTFENAAAFGPGTLTNPAGRTLLFTGNNLVSAPLANQGAIQLFGTTTLNGGFTTAAGSAIELTGNNVNGIATLEVAGGFTNNGGLSLFGDSGVASTLRINGGALVNAAGSTIDGAPGSGPGIGPRTINLSGGADFVNQGTLSVRGLFDVNTGGGSEITNGGTFSVQANRTLTVGTFTNLTGNALAGGTYDVAGTLRVPGAVNTLAASLILGGASSTIFNYINGTNALNNLTTVTPAGSISGSVNFTTGTPVVNSGTVLLAVGSNLTATAGFTNAASGTLGGRGAINAQVSGPGTVSPGESPGNITVNGSITLGGPFVIDLDGPNAGTGYDTMTVMGGVTLNGPLSPRPGFTAPVGALFRIIDNDGSDPVTGTFAGLPQGATVTAMGQTFTVSYTGGDGNDVVLTRVAAPRVAGVAANAGQTNATQRSRVTSIAVTFDAQVTFAGSVAAAFGLSRIGGGAVGGFTATAAVVNGVTVVTLTGFAGGETEFGSLADGRYSVLVRANQVSANGLALDGDGNGQGGDDYALNGTAANGLYRLYGDVNPDGVINAQDFAQFRGAFGTAAGDMGYRDFLDFDGDGFVNAQDFAQFRNRFGSSVP